MTVIAEDWLESLVGEVRPHLTDGAVSTYLPELAQARADDLAVAVDLGSGELLTAGSVGTRFTVQSVVKVFTLLLALHDRGEQHVFQRVGREQGVGTYDSFETFHRDTGVPVNPFVNSGALAVVDMLHGADAEVRVERVLGLLRKIAGNPGITVNEQTARSELARSDHNRALCWYLRSRGIVGMDVEELLLAYCRMCAIEVDVVDLARAGRALASTTGVPAPDGVLNPSFTRLVRRLLLVTGMYEASGLYACDVGIPAKCGVSGAMVGAVADRAGIGIYGPALDRSGNSVGGIRMMGLLAERLDIDCLPVTGTAHERVSVTTMM